jgi:hypothetical protein
MLFVLSVGMATIRDTKKKNMKKKRCCVFEKEGASELHKKNYDQYGKQTDVCVWNDSFE